MIKVTIFRILTTVKLSGFFFLIFSKRSSQSHDPGHGIFNIEFSLYWVVLVL
jgi:hypothetical protein